MSAHSALAQPMNPAARTRMARTGAASRLYRTPDHAAAPTPSAGSVATGPSRRQPSTTSAVNANADAVSANAAPGPARATARPPTAGPTARPTLIATLLRVTPAASR